MAGRHHFWDATLANYRGTRAPHCGCILTDADLLLSSARLSHSGSPPPPNKINFPP